MVYSYDYRVASNRIAYFLVEKVVVDVDVNLNPETISWVAQGQVLMSGKAAFVLPNNKYPSQPYELVVSEDGSFLRCECSDPMQRQLISMAARASKRELAELIKDEKVRGKLRPKTAAKR